MSRLDLIVGPNGAGKSTFVEMVLADTRPGVPFVNADLIAAERWPNDPIAHGHEAAALAEQARNDLIARGEEFVAETVASHPSKVDLVRNARLAGYHVHVIALLVPEEMSVRRVAARVEEGGHDVPEDKVRARYQRLWANVVEMIRLADTAEVFDNSGTGPATVATFVGGEVIGSPQWPAFVPAALVDQWPGG